MVWWAGVFNESEVCSSALGVEMRERFFLTFGKLDGCSVRSTGHRLGIRPWVNTRPCFPVVAAT